MPTRRLPRLVLLLLALVALTAVALPSAGPAAAAPASCAKAKKKVRSAKAKLAKAKRSGASKRSLAKARKGVKLATKAQRAACRVPAPAPPPARPGGPVAPAGEHGPPASGEHPHDHPHEEPAPQPGPGPGPGPDPVKPTSQALIAKALAEGRIDAETALRYEVFAEHGDARLPAEFRGAPLRVADTDTLDRVAERWDDLSPATREALDPFFIPPFNPGSWYEPGSPAGEEAREAAAAPTGAPGSNLCDNTAPNMARWGYVTAAGGKLRVWYENTVTGQQEKAIAVADHLDGGAYGVLTGIFKAPLSDGGDLSGQRCRGFDPAVDIALVPLAGGMNGKAVRYDTDNTCHGPFSGFAVIRRDLSGDDLTAAVIHELSHLAHIAYSGDRCGRDWYWLTEATAQWMVTYADDYGPKHPEDYAGNFLDRPSLPLETYEEVAGTDAARQYGAYVFFQWLANTNGADAVSKVWSRMQSPDNAVDILQEVLVAKGYEGGFEQAWKRFALTGLNPRAQVDWFKGWGLDRGAYVKHHFLASGETEAVPVALEHLAAQYHSFKFTDAVKGIEVTNPLVGQAGASLQVWLRIDDGGFERVDVKDWSATEKATFCRQFPHENVQEMILVVANSTHTSRTHTLTDDPAVRTTASCGAYDATAKATIKRNGLTEVYTAAYTLTSTFTRPAEGGGIERWFSTDNTTVAGNADWSMSGVDSDTGCTWSGQDSVPVGPGHMQSVLETFDFGKDDPRSKYRYGFSIAFHLSEVTISCPSGSSHTIPWQIGHGFQSDFKPWNPEDQGIVGSQTETHPWIELKREWSLSRKVL